MSMTFGSATGFAQAEPEVNVVIAPEAPTADDAIAVTVSGTWRNACVPQTPDVAIEDDEIHIATAVEAGFCAQVLTDFSFTVELEPLTVGSYDLTVTYRQADRDLEVIATTSFDVRASNVDLTVPCGYDANGNGVIDDTELVAAIDDWIDGEIADRVLLQLIDWWIMGIAACNASG